jgi:ribosome maturation factor RimP
MDVEKHIRNYLEELFTGEKYSENFLVDLRVHDNKYEVYIDGDNGVTVERCREISRYLENQLEENSVVGEKYTLEISSPGATRPLTMMRQYGKHVGRTLKITLADGAKLKGKLTGIKGEILQIEEKIKKKGVTTHQVPFSDIRESVVQISFK